MLLNFLHHFYFSFTPLFYTSHVFSFLHIFRPDFQTVLHCLTKMRQSQPGPTPPFRSYEVITDVMQQVADKRDKQGSQTGQRKVRQG